MSYRALNWAWSSDLPASEKFVLVALADMADEHESCFPTQARLAGMVGRTDRSVRDSLKALEARGMIVREHRKRVDGSNTSDRYVLKVHAENTSGWSPGNLRRSTRKDTPGHPEQISGLNRTPTEPPLGTPTNAREETALIRVGDDAVDERVVAFEAAWEAWPKKTEKKRSRDKFLRLARNGDPHQLREVVQECGRAYRDGGWPTQYVPALVVWLNGERWNDPLPEPRQSRGSGVQEQNLALMDQYRRADRGQINA